MVVRSIPHVDLVVSQFVELKSYVCGTQPMDYLEEHGFAMRLIIQSDRVTARARRVVDLRDHKIQKKIFHFRENSQSCQYRTFHSSVHGKHLIVCDSHTQDQDT